MRRLTSPKLSQSPNRSGVAALWLLITALVFVACLQYVLESGWLLMCRTQAQAVAESAALAGARSWGMAATDDATNRSIAKARATDFVVNSAVPGLATEYTNLLTSLQASDNASGTNNNLTSPNSCPGATVSANLVILGDLNSSTLVFSPYASPASAGRRGCMVQFQLTAVSPISQVSRTVSARATAYWDSAASPNRSRLAFVTVTCP
ncbi:MAG: TadE/TadG family type IV pilus assembly protein [Planctomycetota bacterium]